MKMLPLKSRETGKRPHNIPANNESLTRVNVSYDDVKSCVFRWYVFGGGRRKGGVERERKSIAHAHMNSQ